MSALALGLAVLIPITSVFWLSSWLYEGNGFHFPEPWRCLASVLAPVCIAVYGLRKKSLSPDGALTSLIVGFLLTLSSLCFFTACLTFFVVGSRATKYKGHMKRKLEEDFKEGGQRDWKQVLCNGGVASWLAMLYMMEIGCVELPVDFSRRYQTSWLGVAILGSLACCSGDTLASELGAVLAKSNPRLITSFRVVPRGTNGGVSLEGTVASGLGGLIVGVAYYAAVLLFAHDSPVQRAPAQWPLVLVGLVAGLAGSAIDSVIGAWFQYSGFSKKEGKIVETPGPDVEHITGIPLFDNHSVNLLSSLLTGIISPYLASCVIWPLLS